MGVGTVPASHARLGKGDGIQWGVGWENKQSQPGRPAAVGTGQAEPNGMEQDMELREGPRSLPQTPERHPLRHPGKHGPRAVHLTDWCTASK